MICSFRSGLVACGLAFSPFMVLEAAVVPAVGEPGGGGRSDSYPWAGFGFYASAGAGTTINQLGFWDQGGDGLQSAHTVALFKYAGSGQNYLEIARVTVPAGGEAPLEGGYRWVGIPDLFLPDNGQGGNYYVVMASQADDGWTNGLGAGAPMNPSIGTLSSGALDLVGAGDAARINSSGGTLFGGANLGFGTVSTPSTPDEADFINPPLKMKTRPLWFWNNAAVTAAGVAERMQQSRTLDQFGGFGILPYGGNFTPKYLSENYFEVYGAAVAKARELGMKLCLYDEYGFPSGSGGASGGDGVSRFAQAYPEDTIKRLDKFEAEVTGPSAYQRAIPAGGTLMAGVAMNLATLERVDLSASIAGGTLNWSVPAGSWKVMLFVCVKDGDPNVDYLDPAACAKYVGMTHQRYFDHFGADFGAGKTIDGAFFDETTMYRANGRIWTANFNERFLARYGFRPELLYPALWYDIGADTQAARNHLFGLRAELYATGYAKTVQDWCRGHGGIFATGHQDQEEVLNPCNVSGDLMKCFREQDVPGIDKIGGGRPTERFYKVVSSAANNYDKKWVMSETYGDMGNIGFDTIYQVAMDQYTKGINMLIPHAVWYDDGNVTFRPELSWRNPLYASGLAAYNRFMGRLNVMLQKEGRHVADIGVLYPIATLQGGNYLDGPLGNYNGGVAIPEADYADVGALLSETLCRDFTFLHPEILDEKCSVQGKLLDLANVMNREQYRVFVLPGHSTISWTNLKKIRQFYDNGGKVIATRKLPSKSAEFGHDADVVQAIGEMFGEVSPYPLTSASSAWAAGGFDAALASDGSPDSRWNAADGSGGNQWLEVDFGAAKAFDRTVIREVFDRISAYRIQYWDGSGWIDCATGATPGAAKTDIFPRVTASKVRLYVGSVSRDSVSVAEFEVRDGDGPNLATSGPAVTHENANGGKSYFISNANANSLKAALDDALEVYDVEIEGDQRLQSIHKFEGGKNIYYFANLSGAAVDTHVRLRGKWIPQLWDPHTGTIDASPEYSQVTEAGQTVTRVRVSLAHLRSVFVVAAAPAAASSPKVGVSIDGGRISLSMAGLAQDRHYRVTRSSDLLDWQYFDDFIAAGPPYAVAAPDGTVSRTLVDSLDLKAFYRLDEIN